jgi:hypothetical protein
MRAASERRVARRNEVAREYEEAGVPVPGAFALSDSGVVQGTAENLSGTLFGSSIRRGTQESIQAVEARVQEEVARAGGARTPAQAGQDQQEFLRRQLTERSIPSEKVREMTPQQLQDISGVGPGPLWNPPPPEVPPVPPAEITPVTPDAYLRGVAERVPEVPPHIPTDVQIPPVRQDEVPLPPRVSEMQQLLESDYAAAASRRDALRTSIEEAEQAGWRALEAAGYQSAHRGNYKMPEGTIVLAPKDGGPAVWVFPDNTAYVVNREKLSRAADARGRRTPDSSRADLISRGQLDQRAPLNDAELAAVEAVRRGTRRRSRICRRQTVKPPERH